MSTPVLIEFVPLSKRKRNAWKEDDDPLWLLTPAEFDMVPDGTVLESINYQLKTKGEDYIDQDTRMGYIAWGFRESSLPRMPQVGG